MHKNNAREYIVSCESLQFNSKNDKDSFFDWLHKTDYVEKSWEEDNIIYLEVVCLDLHDHDLRDLLALFNRYNLDMKQLQRFLTKENEYWFKDKKKYWYSQVFK